MFYRLNQNDKKVIQYEAISKEYVEDLEKTKKKTEKLCKDMLKAKKELKSFMEKAMLKYPQEAKEYMKYLKDATKNATETVQIGKENAELLKNRVAPEHFLSSLNCSKLNIALFERWISETKNALETPINKRNLFKIVDEYYSAVINYPLIKNQIALLEMTEKRVAVIVSKKGLVEEPALEVEKKASIVAKKDSKSDMGR